MTELKCEVSKGVCPECQKANVCLLGPPELEDDTYHDADGNAAPRDEVLS